MSARIVTCDGCGAPVTHGAPFCPYCRAPLRWGRVLDIERAEPVFLLDLTRQPLPNPGTSLTQRADGTLATMDKPDWESWGTVGPKLRNGCLAIRGVALDPHGTFGVYARLHNEGSARTGYQLKIYPASRTWYFRREAFCGKKTYTDPLIPWEFCAALAGVGSVNEVELRFADSIFQVLLNGERVATLIDASFGFGAIGWVVGSLGARSTVLLRGMAAWRAK